MARNRTQRGTPRTRRRALAPRRRGRWASSLGELLDLALDDLATPLEVIAKREAHQSDEEQHADEARDLANGG